MNIRTHNLAVCKLVDDVIFLINHKSAQAKIFDVAGLLELCRGYVVTQFRETGKPDASTNIVYRDAEYYFIGRMEIAAETGDILRFIESTRWVMLNQGYNAAKAIANFFKTDIMRSDSSRSNSPPGGIEWLKAGIVDALNDKGSEYGEIPPRLTVAEFDGAK